MASPESRPEPSKSQSASFLGLTILLALFGQITLLDQSLPISYGLGLYAVAGGLFVWTLRSLEPQAIPLALPQFPTSSGQPGLALWFTSLALMLITVQGVNAPNKTPLLGRMLVVTWILSIVVFSFSALRVSGWRFPSRDQTQSWWRAHWREVLAVAGLCLLALAVRTYDLELHPYSFMNDEAEVGKEAWRIVTGARTGFFDVAWASQPVWAFVPPAVMVKLFGHTAFALRFVGSLVGALSVVFLYLLGREVFDRTTGFLAAGILLALPFHVHFSRLGVQNVVDALFSTLTLLLTYRAFRRGTLPAYLLAGLATGLALYTYLGSRLAMALVVGTLTYFGLRQRYYVRTHFRQLVVFAGMLVVVGAPMGYFFWKHPDHFYARLNAEGILQSGFLEREAATGKGYLRVLLDQFTKSSLVYTARPAVAGFFNSPQPYLTSLAAIFSVLGMSYTLWRLSEPRYMTLFAWFWSVVILGSTLTVGPPASQRLLMSAPALALLVALGLHKTATALVNTGLLPGRTGPVLCTMVVTVVSVQGVNFYFNEYRGGHYFADASNELCFESRQYTAALGADYRLYLIGDPSVYIVFATFDYFAPDLEKQDFNTVTPASVAALPPDRGAFFLAIPERRADLERVSQWVPGGQWIEIRRRYQPLEMLYYAYQATPEQFAQR